VDLYIHSLIRLHGVVQDRNICNKSSSCFCFTINSEFHAYTQGCPLSLVRPQFAAGTMYNFVGHLTTLNSFSGLVVRVPTHPPTSFTYLPAYLPPTHIHTYRPAYPPTYLPNYLPTHLPTGLTTYLPTYIPTDRPNYPPTSLSVCVWIRLSKPVEK
jgi:hypothetical protein